jgi:hypothetical protein
VKRAILLSAFIGGTLGCAELVDDVAGPLAGPNVATETVCTARNARGQCTGWAQRETNESRWLRETTDERKREEAYRKGEPFFPQEVAGESAEERVRRMDEERRRQDAYRKGEPFFPDHEANEPVETYVRRMQEEQRRENAYRKNEPFFPDTSRR